MSGLRTFSRRVTAGAKAAIGRRKRRRALVAGTALAVAVAFGIGAHNWANAAPATPRPPGVPRTNLAAGTTVPGHYIVTLKSRGASAASIAATAGTMTRSLGGVVTHTYSKVMSGFAAQMSAAQAKAMAARPEVARVEPDRIAKTTDTVPNAQWNLDRVDQPYLPLDHSYTFPVAATNVHAYVLDTGIHISHVAFGGNASYGINETDGTAIADDCVGHGTHVAGTIGGTGFGVAPGVKLVAVKVLGWDVTNNVPFCNGTGLDSQIIAGIDWVTTNAIKPAVANMSLGGSHSDALDAAVANSIASGISYSIAAGNDGLDTCAFDSPGDVPAAITVGATDINDQRPLFSNTGPCVDIFAPGVNVTSALNTNNTGTLTASGTSMAAPHVAGAAALILASNPTYTPQQVSDVIALNAVTGAVDNPGIGSPNKLLQVNGRALFQPEVIRLRARANNTVVTADSSGTSRLIANRLATGAWEDFDLVDAGNGFVGLRSHANGKFVSADAAGTAPLINNRSSIGAWEMFQVVNNPDGWMSLKANANGMFVSADNGGTRPLIANRAAAGPWEEFTRAVGTSMISFLSVADPDFNNWRFVSADNGGNSPLIANRFDTGAWETFDAADLGDGFIALRSHANNKWVTAEAGGAAPLIARGGSVGAWERYQIVDVGDGSIGLKANANLKFVTAEADGTAPLIARSTSLGAWQMFIIFAD